MNKAQKFRTIADESKEEYHQMLRFLKKEAKKGNYSISLPRYRLNEPIIQKLKQDGFIVHTTLEYDPETGETMMFYNINWK